MSRFLHSRIRIGKQYPLLILLSAFITGILLQHFIKSVSPVCWFLCTIILGIITIGLHRIRSAKEWIFNIRIFSIILAFLMLAATLSSVQDIRNHKSWYGHHIPYAETIAVKVTDIPFEKSKTLLVPVACVAVKLPGKWLNAKGNIALYVYREGLGINYRPGQTLLIPNKLISIRNSGNPFAFDQAKLAQGRGIFHQAFLSADQISIVKNQPQTLSPVYKLKQTLQAAIALNVKDTTTRALIEATLLNERNSLDGALMAAYSNTGIIHIIAISGMHIVLLASIILFLLRFIPVKQLQGIKYGIAIILVWIYIALTGFPPSAVRAGIMFTLLAIGLIFNRTNNSINTWAAAGLLLLCYNPYWIYDVGVQLSFLAVLSILLFYMPVKKWITPGNRILKWLWEVIAVSIAAQILVFPLVIYYFNQFPLLGLIANVPAALYSLLLMIGALILFVLHAAGFSCLWLGNLLTYLTKSFNAIILFLSVNTPDTMRHMYIDVVEYWLMMGVIISLGIFCFEKKGIYLLSGLGICILFISCLIAKDIAAIRQEKLVVYNVTRSSLADIFKGKKAIHLFTPDAQQTQYNIRPAMLGFRANREEYANHKDMKLITIKKENILFMERCSLKPLQNFKVDVLIISDQCIFKPQQWFEIFHPKKIILDGSLPRWKALKWQKELLGTGVQVHWVQEDGAWIYP